MSSEPYDGDWKLEKLNLWLLTDEQVRIQIILYPIFPIVIIFLVIHELHPNFLHNTKIDDLQ